MSEACRSNRHRAVGTPEPRGAGEVGTSGWTAADVGRIRSAQEVQISTARADGSFAARRTIWIVDSAGRLFIRSTNGRTAAWFRAAIGSGRGVLRAGAHAFEVTFTEAPDSELAAVDAAYRRKYGRYPSIVDHLQETGPRSATLEVHPA